jgi:subtilase family serine protease
VFRRSIIFEPNILGEHCIMKRPYRRELRPRLEHLDERCLPTTGLTVAQLIQAYNLTTLSNGTSDNGSGQTIALIEAYHDPNLTKNVQTFDTSSQNGGLNLGSSTSFLTVDNLAGSTTNAGWAGEEELDVEVAHAIAPGAKILVIEAKSASIQDLMTAVTTANSLAKADNVTVVSMSWGGSEFSGETAYDKNFQTPGITYVASAGDSVGAEYPASSPYVVSVGGTTLNLNSSNAIASEATWSSSGGGTSLFEAKPSYQSSLPGSTRTTPDVTFDGDPNSGIMVYTTGNFISQSSWYQVGGTSVGAPAWAGIIAITNEALVNAGQKVLDSTGPTQTLTDLYKLANTNAFNSVAAAPSNGGFFGGGGFFGSRFRFFNPPTATTSALGSPNGANLVSDLVSVVGTGTVPSSAITHASSATTSLTSTAGHSTQTVLIGLPTPPSFGGSQGFGLGGFIGGVFDTNGDHHWLY